MKKELLFSVFLLNKPWERNAKCRRNRQEEYTCALGKTEKSVRKLTHWMLHTQKPIYLKKYIVRFTSVDTKPPEKNERGRRAGESTASMGLI